MLFNVHGIKNTKMTTICTTVAQIIQCYNKRNTSLCFLLESGGGNMCTENTGRSQTAYRDNT